MKREIAITIATRAAILVAGVAAAIVTARFLGPAGRGEYFFVVMLAAAVTQFGSLGLQASNTYLVASDRSLLGRLTVNSVWVALVVGLSAGTAVAAVSDALDLFPGTPGHLLWFVVPLAPVTLFFLLGMNLLVGTGRIGLFNALEAASHLVLLALLATAGALALGVAGFLTASVAGWAIVALMLAALLAPERDRLRFDAAIFRRGFRFATKSYLVVLLGFFVLRTNVFLVQHFIGAEELGYYSIAAQVSDALVILPTSVALVLFPRLVSERTTSWESTRRACAATGLILAGVCAAVALAAAPLVRIAFGEEFEPAVPILRLMLPGVLAVGMTTVLSQYLAAIGLPRSLVAIWAAGFAMAFALGAVLVREHGGEGAAVALSITYGLLFVAMLLTARKHRAAGQQA